jgi:L-lactate dehydrogenase complex protein LldG
MLEVTSRESILKKIRQALIQKSPQRFPTVDMDHSVYIKSDTGQEETFALAFKKTGGQFVFCDNETDFLEKVVILSEENNWKQFYCREKKLTAIMDQYDFPYISDDKNFPEGIIGITTCEALVSRLGSVIVSSRQGSGRKLFVVPTVHIIVAYTSQIVSELKDAVTLIKNKYGDQLPSLIAALTGPSRTADIEKTLVTPAHGPRDIFVFLMDD